MPNVKHARFIHTSRRFLPSGPSVPLPRAESWGGIDGHELHRALDGRWRDWPPGPPARAELRASLASGLAAVATLPVVDLLLARFSAAPSQVAAAIASLPLVALLLVASTWEGRGEP